MNRFLQMIAHLTACFVPFLAYAEPCPETLECREGAHVREERVMRRCVLRDEGQSWHGQQVRCVGDLLAVREDYENGRAVGLHETWFENGVKESEQPFVDGEPDGTYRRWYEDGVLRDEIGMRKGERFGLERAWHPNGAIKHKVVNTAAGPHGWYEAWHPDGTLASVTHYRDGKRDGPHRRYHPDGSIFEQAEYKNGLAHGDYVYRDERGVLIRQGRWEDNKMVGEWTEVDQTQEGHKHVGSYADNTKHGRWETFNAAGELILAQTYDRAILNGPYEVYEAGKLKQAGRYERGYKDGVWETFAGDGSVALKETFDFGMQLETCRPSGNALKCRSEVPWRAWGERACKPKTLEMGAFDVFDQETFDARFECPEARNLPPIDWTHYRLWTYSFAGVEGEFALTDVRRRDDAFGVEIVHRQICTGVHLPSSHQVIMVLMPKSQKTIAAEIKNPKYKPCGLRP